MVQASDGVVQTEMGDANISITPGICTCSKKRRKLTIATSKGLLHVGCRGFIP